jgi:hypothetical protein
MRIRALAPTVVRHRRAKVAQQWDNMKGCCMRKTLSMQAAGRTWRLLLGGAILPIFLSTGCAGTNNTTGGAIAGTAIGAGTGAIIGHAIGGRCGEGAGALIGGGVGLATGAVVGNSIDQKNEKKAEQQAAAAQAEVQSHWPSLAEIQQMSASGTGDNIIINQIRATHAVYRLSANDILWLQQNGVHDAVISEMQATATRVPQRVIVEGAPPPPGVVVVEPAPVVGVGFGYRRAYYWR